MTDLEETIADGVATLTLNRPDRLNALSDAMLRGLLEALPRLGMNQEVGAIVLTGAGRGFCAGGDVKAMAERGAGALADRLEDLRWKHHIPVLLRTLPKIVIAAVNGPAFGAGFSLALACDLRIAGHSARFGTAFAGVGLSGDFGGSWTLTRLVGPARARELYFTAAAIDSAEAERLGLVSRVVDDARLAEEAASLARRFAEGPRAAYAAMKRNLHAAETQTLPEVLELEALQQVRSALTEDHREAAQAFVEKRRPVFRGR